MNKKTTFLILVFFLFFSAAALAQPAANTQGPAGADIRLRFFEGLREGAAEPAKVITSSFLHSTITASIKSDEDLAEEQKQIKKTFNLKDVKLLTEAVLKWPAREPGKVSHILRLDGQQYLIFLTPLDQSRKGQFRVEVFEQSDGAKKNLLDTEVVLPAKNIAVFGFEDTQQKPYFLSLRAPQAVLGGVKGGIKGGVEGGVEGGVKGGVSGGVAGGVEGGLKVGVPVPEDLEKFAKGAVKVEGDLKPPKLAKRFDPVYPEEAAKAGIEGTVILEARIDALGKVSDVMVLRSVPQLDQAAVEAIKKWVYEPMLIKGKPVEAVFTVTVRFALYGGEKKDTVKKEGEDLEKEAVRATGEINPPHLIKRVNPVYPEDARKAGIQGTVILEAMSDEQGNVVRVKVLQSIPELDQAAVDALKQWKYEPVIIDGKPKAVVFTVTIRFRLD